MAQPAGPRARLPSPADFRTWGGMAPFPLAEDQLATAHTGINSWAGNMEPSQAVISLPPSLARLSYLYGVCQTKRPNRAIHTPIPSS